MHIRSHLAKLFNSKADGPTSPPSYVDFNQPVGVLRSFSETKETLQTQMALKGVEGGKVTHEGFVKVSLRVVKTPLSLSIGQNMSHTEI